MAARILEPAQELRTIGEQAQQAGRRPNQGRRHNEKTMDTSTLCYPQRSKNYKYLKAEVYRQETAALLDILERCKTGMQQLAVIITMNDITVRSSRYGDRGFGSWGSRIHNTLLRSVEEYGKKAAPLSAKQLEIVCRDFQTRWQRERQFDDSLSA